MEEDLKFLKDKKQGLEEKLGRVAEEARVGKEERAKKRVLKAQRKVEEREEF